MNNGVTINIPEINWPFVFLVFGLIWAFRSGYFKRSPAGKRKASKPKSKGKPGTSRQTKSNPGGGHRAPGEIPQ